MAFYAVAGKYWFTKDFPDMIYCYKQILKDRYKQEHPEEKQKSDFDGDIMSTILFPTMIDNIFRNMEYTAKKKKHQRKIQLKSRGRKKRR